MKQLLIILLVAIFGTSFIPSGKIEYSIDKKKIKTYRKNPVTNETLIKIIEKNEEFIRINWNSAISEATLEHHLINEQTSNGVTTFIIFEYFFLEGTTCKINAVTIDSKNNLLSILRLASYEEYPDGNLQESTILENDYAERITITNGLQEYNDSLDLFIMKIDSTIVRYKLNNFTKIEVVDSIFKHHEHLK